MRKRPGHFPGLLFLLWPCACIDGEALKRRLHALDEAGRLHVGLDAFILSWSRLPRFRWLSRLAVLPPVHAVAGWFYENVLASVLSTVNRLRERRVQGE
jgi:predicted DCC family thiol-disulfide oxidoreductase YuxK